MAQGGFAAWVGTPGATGDGARRLPLQLLALDRAWRELELEVGLPEGWRVREVLPGRALYEAGAELVTVRRAGGLSLRVLRPEGADPVGDGEVAVVVVQATAAGAVDVQVQTPGAAEAVAHVESRVVLD
ncbi:MAG: hypothetical protein R3F62_02280 [Planctomycetota bacterium]